MSTPHTKQQRRDRAWTYKGNALVAVQIVKPAGLEALSHPNRILSQFRSSNKGRRVE